MTTPTADRTSTLTQDVRAMLIAEIPAISFLGKHLAMITAVPHEQDPARIDVTVTPVDFQSDNVEVSVSIRVDSITRVESQAAVAAGTNRDWSIPPGSDRTTQAE